MLTNRMEQALNEKMTVVHLITIFSPLVERECLLWGLKDSASDPVLSKLNPSHVTAMTTQSCDAGRQYATEQSLLSYSNT